MMNRKPIWTNVNLMVEWKSKQFQACCDVRCWGCDRKDWVSPTFYPSGSALQLYKVIEHPHYLSETL